ncbi:MAG: NAD(P)-binding protein [Planctomycetota bacterium]
MNLTRRTFLRRGMSAAALGVLGRRGLGIQPPRPAPPRADAGPLEQFGPFASVPLHPESVMVGDLPFAPWFTGDYFTNDSIPFHTCQNCFEGGEPPAPTEEVDIAVVGGGISGLTTAYLLRHHRPVLFELRPHFGGSAQGEVWGDTHYSLGNAYVITPDPGSFEHRLYHRLGLHRVVRLHEGDDLIELGGDILDDFWTGAGRPPEEVAAFQRYAEVVTDMAENKYPDIPLPRGQDNQWILDLDQKTLRQHIEERMDMPVPPLLAAAIQAYCYSSFAAGWDEISAASGWNFLAAEEFGRWVFPGGNAYMADALWRKLRHLDGAHGSGSRMRNLRAGCNVVDVRLVPGDKVQVTYAEVDGQFRSLLARRVVMCCPKIVCRQMIHRLAALDPDKLDAIYRLDYRAYLVVNVLLNTAIERDFYDVFLLGEGDFPMSDGEAEANSRVVDMLNGHYARQQSVPRSVLTLYWPMPFGSGRVRLINNDVWINHTAELVPQIHAMLAMLDVPPGAVRQVRMTRWGHALPVAARGLIADGTIEHLRRPLEGRIFFANQDNWALPAVENCLLDAEIFVPQIAASL